MAILSEIVHYVILNTFSRMVICFWLLSLGDIRHLSCRFLFFCFIVILDWLGVALSNFHHCMLTWWRSHSSSYVNIDLLVLEWKWKQKNHIFGNTVSEHIFFSGRVSEPHFWATMMSLVSIYSGRVDWDVEGFFLLNFDCDFIWRLLKVEPF